MARLVEEQVEQFKVGDKVRYREECEVCEEIVEEVNNFGLCEYCEISALGWEREISAIKEKDNT